MREQCLDQNDKRIHSAEEETKRKWDLIERVRALSDRIPFDEPAAEDFRPIHFDDAHQLSGLLISLVAGTTLRTKENGVILVPRRTRLVLEKLEIPYNEGFGNRRVDLSELTQWDY